MNTSEGRGLKLRPYSELASLASSLVGFTFRRLQASSFFRRSWSRLSFRYCRAKAPSSPVVPSKTASVTESLFPMPLLLMTMTPFGDRSPLHTQSRIATSGRCSCSELRYVAVAYIIILLLINRLNQLHENGIWARKCERDE